MSTAQYTNMTADEAVRFMADAPTQPVRTRVAEIVGEWDVVDLGCGKGEEVQDVWAPEHYLGIDCSAELIRIAQYRNPHHQFQVSPVQDVVGHWTFGLLKSVLEHLPYPEALAVYEHARSITDTLLLVWHTEPGHTTFTQHYQGELDSPMIQTRHPRYPFNGRVAREECGPHVIWTVV